MDQAERRAAAATTHAAASDAVKEAQRALDAARRMRGPANERAAIIRELERKVEHVKRVASAVADASLQAEASADRVRRENEFAARVQGASRLRTALLGVPAHLAAKTASPTQHSLAQGYAQVAGNPRNNKYASQRFPLAQRHPELAAKYPDSVEFDDQGFPDFSPYAVAIVQLPQLPGELREKSDGKFEWNRELDFNEADVRAGWTKESRKQAGLVWHHHQDGKTMLLVPGDLHEKVGHTGGVAHEMNVAGPQRLITNYVVHSMHELLDDDGEE